MLPNIKNHFKPIHISRICCSLLLSVWGPFLIPLQYAGAAAERKSWFLSRWKVYELFVDESLKPISWSSSILKAVPVKRHSFEDNKRLLCLWCPNLWLAVRFYSTKLSIFDFQTYSERPNQFWSTETVSWCVFPVSLPLETWDRLLPRRVIPAGLHRYRRDKDERAGEQTNAAACIPPIRFQHIPKLSCSGCWPFLHSVTTIPW
jgi:hypothetical protein